MYNGDGASQFAGGGFIPSPGAAGNSPGVKAGGAGKNDSLTPVTVKHLNDALAASQDDAIRIDGEDLQALTLVGKVTHFADSSTMLQYTVDDGTGKVEVRFWLDDEEGGGVSDIQVGTYVRVYGNLRSFQGQRNIVAFQIRPVTDFNEVTFHLLETIFVHLKRMKGGGGEPTTPSMKFNPNHAAATYQTPVPAYNGGGGGAAGGGGRPVVWTLAKPRCIVSLKDQWQRRVTRV